MRAIQGRPISLVLEVDDENGIPTDADDDTNVTVSLTAGDGTAILTNVDATDVDTVGIYTYVAPPQAQLDNLLVTWNATVNGQPQVTYDLVRVVGARILSPADIRADSSMAGLNATIEGRRCLAEILDAVEDLLASALGYPALPEGIRFNFDAHRGTFAEAYAYGNVQTGVFSAPGGIGFGFGGERLIIPGVAKPLTVYALTINGAAVTDDLIAQFQGGNGYLVWMGGRSWPSGNYEFWMTHGAQFVPGDLRTAAATLAGYYAKRTLTAGQGVRTLIPERTASITTEGGTIVFAVPTADRPTGLPEVDAVVFRYALENVV